VAEVAFALAGFFAEPALVFALELTEKSCL
jgi:hypothetical protein